MRRIIKLGLILFPIDIFAAFYGSICAVVLDPFFNHFFISYKVMDRHLLVGSMISILWNFMYIYVAFNVFNTNWHKILVFFSISFISIFLIFWSFVGLMIGFRLKPFGSTLNCSETTLNMIIMCQFVWSTYTTSKIIGGRYYIKHYVHYNHFNHMNRDNDSDL